MSKKALWIIVGLIVVIVITIVAVSTNKTASYTDTNGDTMTETMPADTTQTATTTASSTDATIGTTDTFTVEGSNFKFVPSTLTVKKGDTVHIIFKNTGGIHDFKIDEFNVATKQITGGSQDEVTFVADKAGSFQYYCSVGNHRAMGMWGTLTVTE